MVPEIVSIDFPTTIYQEVSYDFPFEIKVRIFLGLKSKVHNLCVYYQVAPMSRIKSEELCFLI